MRVGIAVPFWALVRTATTGVAGGELEFAAEVLSDDNRAPSAPSDTVMAVIKA